MKVINSSGSISHLCKRYSQRVENEYDKFVIEIVTSGDGRAKS